MKTYQEIKEELKSLEGKYQWGSESDLLFAKQKSYLKIKRHALETYGVQFGAFETADRGVALVQFVYEDIGDTEPNGELIFPTGFNLNVNFIEEPEKLVYGCPKMVHQKITDENAATYLEKNWAVVKDMLSIGERLRQQAIQH